MAVDIAAVSAARETPLIVTFEDMARGLHFDGVEVLLLQLYCPVLDFTSLYYTNLFYTMLYSTIRPLIVTFEDMARGLRFDGVELRPPPTCTRTRHLPTPHLHTPYPHPTQRAASASTPSS